VRWGEGYHSPGDMCVRQKTFQVTYPTVLAIGRNNRLPDTVHIWNSVQNLSLQHSHTHGLTVARCVHVLLYLVRHWPTTCWPLKTLQ